MSEQQNEVGVVDSAFAAGLLGGETVWDLLDSRAHVSATGPMLFDSTPSVLTFDDVRRRALHAASWLHRRGIGPGSRVAWKLPTRTDTVVVMMALARLGAVQAPIISAYGPRETHAALVAASAEFLLLPTDRAGENIEAELGDLAKTLSVIDIGPEISAPQDSLALPSPPVDGGALRWIFFTSGSSGRPKGCWHSDRSVLLASRGFAERSGMGSVPGDVGSIVYPIAHVGGLVFLTAMLIAGFPSVLLESFKPQTVLEVFNQHRVSISGGSTAVYRAILGMQQESGSTMPIIPTLRLLKGGGAPCPPDLYQRIKQELGGVILAHDYGMTEAPIIGAAGPADTDDQLSATDGRPIAGVQVRIVDADGAATPRGADGEIELSGAVLFRGYTDPDDNAEAFTADGWFRTGDRGRLRHDGHLEVTGRTKDLIIRKGENIAPAELEQLLRAHRAVADVAVIGLPDDVRGERVCAVVVPRDGAQELALDEIVGFLRGAGVMPQKLPEQLEIVAELPLRGLAKVDKVALRNRFATPPPQSPVEETRVTSR